MAFSIYPPIGLARIGNSNTEFFFGPERPGSLGTENSPDGEREVTSFKDSQFRMKRQAARFQIFEVSDDGTSVPAQLPAEAHVRWSVRIVNKKDAVVRPGRPPSEPRRPALAPGRGDRVIDTGMVQAIARATAPLEGAYRGQSITLGELHVDARQRLIVLGGFAESASPTNAPIGGSFYNNPDWFDDLGDGPVEAQIEMPDGLIEPVTPAWVIVGPPDFAPGCAGVVTIYDVMRQVGIDLGDLAAPQTTSFARDVRPLVERTANLRWVDNGASWPLVSTDMTALADPGAGAAALRAETAEFVRSTEQLLHDYALRTWQHDHLNRWEAGNFDTSAPAAGDEGAVLARAVLDGGVGQGFFPGIEAGIIITDPTIYVRPFQFRFDPAQVSAGDITALMALPWQADFLKCNSGWWPTQRPDVGPQADGSRPPWVRPSMNHRSLVANVTRLGVITPVATGGVVSQRELGRDPTL